MDDNSEIIKICQLHGLRFSKGEDYVLISHPSNGRSIMLPHMGGVIIGFRTVRNVRSSIDFKIAQDAVEFLLGRKIRD